MMKPLLGAYFASPAGGGRLLNHPGKRNAIHAPANRPEHRPPASQGGWKAQQSVIVGSRRRENSPANRVGHRVCQSTGAGILLDPACASCVHNRVIGVIDAPDGIPEVRKPINGS
jgi:hypothetical protein